MQIGLRQHYHRDWIDYFPDVGVKLRIFASLTMGIPLAIVLHFETMNCQFAL